MVHRRLQLLTEHCGRPIDACFFNLGVRFDDRSHRFTVEHVHQREEEDAEAFRFPLFEVQHFGGGLQERLFEALQRGLNAVAQVSVGSGRDHHLVPRGVTWGAGRGADELDELSDQTFVQVLP